MKTLSSLLAVLLLTTVGAFAGEWQTDYKAALAQAAKEKKMVLLDFTGSDWCGWCIKLDKDIFSQPKFKDYAHDNLVLVELDFPRRKSQPTEEKKQNVQLAQQYEVLGFPTIVVLNSNGQKVWQFDGYFPGGAEAFIAQLQKLPKG